MEAFSTKIFLPLFSVRYREAWGVRLSPRLPPPRTILGALAKSLGVFLGVGSGEEPIAGKPARVVFTEAVETSSYAFVRPLSPLVKTSQILRIVPGIEQDKVSSDILGLSGCKFSRELAGLHDAFKCDVIFSGEMEFIFVVDLAELNNRLTKYGIEEVGVDALISALRMIDRVGPTEAMSGMLSVKYVEQVARVDPPATINAYAPVEEPVAWVEPVYGASQNYLIEPLYPNLRIIGERFITKETREIKINFILPISCSVRRRGREFFEPSSVLVRPKAGYDIYSIEGADDDLTRIVLPRREVGYR
jgi:CRISPR-associated protein Cas5 subtype I-A